DANVGDEDEAGIANVDGFLLLRVPALRAQEKQSALASAVRRLAKMLAKIKCGVIRFPFILHRDRLPLRGDPRDVFLVKVFGVRKEGRFELSLRLAHEVIDLRRGDAADLELNGVQSARPDRHFFLAVEREHSTLAFDLYFSRE